MELSFLGAKVPGNESSRERKFHPMELSFPGAKVLWNESSCYRECQRKSLDWIETVRGLRLEMLRDIDAPDTRVRTGLRSGSRLWFWLQPGLGLETLLDTDAPDAGGRIRRILPVPGKSAHATDLAHGTRCTATVIQLGPQYYRLAGGLINHSKHLNRDSLDGCC